jgi:hypothetical protein
MEAMTIDAVLQQIRAVPGVLSADIKGKRLWIKVADRDLYPVRRRVAAWLARCETSQLGLLWEMESATSCGCYDSRGHLKKIENWSLTSLQRRLVKTGGRLVKHARYLLADAGREPSHTAVVREYHPAD